MRRTASASLPPKRFLKLGDLVLGAPSRKFERVRHHRRGRGRRPIPPQAVDRVPLLRQELDAGLAQSLGEALDLFYRVQVRVVADLASLRKLALDPVRGLGIGRLQHLEERGVDLRARLQRVAAVHKKSRNVAQHDGSAGRPGEAGQPAQTLGARRQKLVLMLVAVRNEKPVKVAGFEFKPQRLDAFWRYAWGGDLIEALKHGLSLVGRCSATINRVTVPGFRRDEDQGGPSIENEFGRSSRSRENG